MGTAIKHPAPARVKPSFVSVRVPGCQKLQWVKTTPSRSSVLGDSLGGAVSEFLLTESDVLFDAVAEATTTPRDVADDAVLTGRIEREPFESVVFYLSTNDLHHVSVDRLHETVVVATIRH